MLIEHVLKKILTVFILNKKNLKPAHENEIHVSY